MKALAVHYKNKYPKGRVDFAEDKLDAYDSEGELRVSLRRNGNGVVIDAGQSTGALDKHDLSAIPKNARVYKLYDDGRIAKSEESEQRSKDAESIAIEGKVLSVDEYRKHGASVDDKGNVKIAQAQAAQ